MKSKKIIIPLLFCAFVSFFVMQSSAPPPPLTPGTFEAEPPIVEHIWVKKLPSTLPGGLNMLMKIQFKTDPRLAVSMNIYYGDGLSVTFLDNGAGPDATASDGIYSAYIKESLTDFVSEIEAMESSLAADSSFLYFQGHIGHHITTLPQFDSGGFDAGNEVEINPQLLEAVHCSDDLLKQNSLFITDLGVVEDGSRTYNFVYNTGNPLGIYNFGSLMKNICNQGYSGVAPKEFLKRWLRRWTETQVINGETIPARPFVFHFLIGPWIQKAGGSVGAYYYADLDNLEDDNNNSIPDWEEEWDGCSEDSLLKYAPFRLMAIVNRIDLRGNGSFQPNPTNAGETRLIYTLIAPFELNAIPAAMTTSAGMPPKGADGQRDPLCKDLLDWQGMNIIFEFGNPLSSRCEMRTLAKKWADLSSLTLGSSEYNDSLESILLPIISANAAPLRTDNNRSALNQIRTNERIFFPSGCNFPNQNNWGSL